MHKLIERIPRLLGMKKIKNQFLAAMMFLILISVPALGIMSYRISASIIERNHTRSYQSSLQTSGRILEATLDSIVSASRTFLYDQEFLLAAQNTSFAHDPDGKRARDALLQEKMRYYTFYLNDILWAGFYDQNGTLYSGGSRVNSLGAMLNSSFGQVSKTDWYRQIIEAQGKEVFFSYDVLDPTNANEVFTCGKLVRVPGSLEELGVLITCVRTRIFRSAFPSAGTDAADATAAGCYMILDAGSSREQNLLYCNNPSFHEALAKKQVPPGLFDEESGFFTTRFQNGATGWQLVHTVRLDDLLRDTGTIKRYTAFTAVMTAAVAILLFLLLSNSINRPLHKLERVIEEVGDGKRVFDEQFSDDEIGTIGNKFLEMIGENYRLNESVAQLRLRQKEAQLKCLQAEINPHFLYNTLDSIYWMANLQKVPEIGQMAISLSKVFKISLNSGGETTTVRREIEQVENYLIIQSLRYKDKLEYHIEAEEDILECEIIKIILQPFVENAVLHGLEPKEGKGALRLRGKREGEDIFFTVEDDGVGMADTAQVHAGYGVQNVVERVGLYYGERGRITFQSRPGQGTRVTIRLPAQFEGPWGQKGGEPC